jgi:nicotinamidase-related amidase
LLEALAGLVERAHAAEVLVIFVQHTSDAYMPFGSDGWQLQPSLKPTETDKRIYKIHPNAFEGTELAEVLEEARVGILVIAGLVTHGCVKATTLDALERGYHVILVSDGHSSYSLQAADLIEKWNGQLSAAGAELAVARAIDFSKLNSSVENAQRDLRSAS